MQVQEVRWLFLEELDRWLAARRPSSVLPASSAPTAPPPSTRPSPSPETPLQPSVVPSVEALTSPASAAPPQASGASPSPPACPPATPEEWGLLRQYLRWAFPPQRRWKLRLRHMEHPPAPAIWTDLCQTLRMTPKFLLFVYVREAATGEALRRQIPLAELYQMEQTGNVEFQGFQAWPKEVPEHFQFLPPPEAFLARLPTSPSPSSPDRPAPGKPTPSGNG